MPTFNPNLKSSQTHAGPLSTHSNAPSQGEDGKSEKSPCTPSQPKTPPPLPKQSQRGYGGNKRLLEDADVHMPSIGKRTRQNESEVETILKSGGFFNVDRQRGILCDLTDVGKKIDDEDPKLVGYLTLEDLEKCGLFDLFSVKKALEKEDGIKTFIEDENDSNSASIYAFHENLLHEFLSTKDNPNILKKNKLLKNDLLDASHFVHQLAKTNFEDSLHTAEAQVIDNFFDLHENKSLMEKHGFYFNEDEDNEADFREQFADFVAENKDKINSKFKSLKEQGKKADKTNEIDDLEKLIQLMALVTDIDLGEYNTEEIIKQLEKKGVPQKDRTVAGHVEKFNNLVDLQELIDIAFNDRGRLY